MDLGKGELGNISEEKAKELEKLIRNAINYRKITLKGSGIFRVGETIELKGSRFKITNITSRKLSLTLLKFVEGK